MLKFKAMVGLCGLGVLVAGCELPASGSAFMELDPYLGATTTKAKLDQDVEADYELEGIGMISGVSGIDGQKIKAFGGYTVASSSPVNTATNYVPNQNMSFVTRYRLAHSYDINKSTYYLTGSSKTASGLLTLSLDIDNNTLSGSGANLSLDTKFEGSQLSGTGQYKNVPLEVKGEFMQNLQSDKAVIGAFHGHTDSEAVGGGFIGEEAYAMR